MSRTGGIGNIAVASWERFRGGTRVEFLCGVRALRGYDALRVTVTESTGLLSIHAADLPSAIERLQNEGRESKRRIRELQSALARFEGEALMAGAHRHGGIAIVACAMSGWDANGLKTIASGIASQPGFLVVLVTAPDPASIVAARSADVAVDSAALLRAITARFGGKGGGRPELAQGGGLSGNANDIADFARSVAAASAAGT